MSSLPSTTGDRVLEECNRRTKVKFHKGQWQMNDPRKPSSDSNSMWLTIDPDGEHGAWCYFAGGESGSLYELAQALGVELPQLDTQKISSVDLTRQPEESMSVAANTPKNVQASVKQAKISKREYTGIQDYLDSKGVSLAFAERFGWSQMQWSDKPVIAMEHSEGTTRIRHLGDGGGFQPIKAHADKNNFRCFYKFDEAFEMARSNQQPLVICNGQPSVLSAHYHGVNAFAQTDGEIGGLQNNLLNRLVAAVVKYRLKIIIAMDGDEPGRKQAETIANQLAVHGIDAPRVDFGGNDGYDLGDFCKQHTNTSTAKIVKLAELRSGQITPTVHTDAMHDRLENMMTKIRKLRGQIIHFPFPAITKIGGFADLMMPRKATYIYGGTGSGKTIFLENIADGLQKDGVVVLWWSPEWDSDEYTWRQIQRECGISYMQLVYHFTDIQVLTAHQIKQVQAASDTITKRPGKTIVYQTDRFTEHVLARMINDILILRRDNPDVKIVPIFDYAQRMRVLNDEKDRTVYETAMDYIKTMAEDYHVHPIISAQVKKSTDRNQLLELNDAQWVRADFANLVLTLNPQYEEDGITLKTMRLPTGVSGDNEVKDHNILSVNIAKNSMGSNGIVKIPIDYTRLKLRLLQGSVV